MAAHRKHRKRKERPLSPWGGHTARTAATLALAGAATGVVVDGSAHAEPQLTSAQVKAKIDKLYHEAEIATEKYNGTKEKADSAQSALDDLQDEAARRTARLDSARTALGSTAAAQYRTGAVDPSVQLALSSDPDQYLDRATLADRAADRQAASVTGVRRQLRDLDQLRTEAAGTRDRLRDRRAELADHKAKITDKLADAKSLLSRLTEADRARLAGGDRASRDTGRAPAPGAVKAPNARAAQAVAFAHEALGSPYVWGATGPDSFDCSGLTQAAWRAAGVSLPRTTYTQINAGERIPRSQLAPGDLVFFNSSISHVGLYVGGGQMIHAPNPSAPVRLAPITEMPFAGATRVG